MKLGGTVPAGEVYVDGSGVGDVGAVVMRDRKRLAEDGMVVVVLPISAHDGNLLSEPEIITRGFIYVKESGDLDEGTAERGPGRGGERLPQAGPG